jgi:MazG family protein
VSSKNTTKLESFQRLLTIMDDLREKCPWDKKQTFESLRNLTIEETYELADAILKKDYTSIKEEIGDLFLHLVFYSKLGEETGKFDVADVLNGINEKLIQRHPHIYGDIQVDNDQEVLENWEKLKLKEGKKSVLEGVPDGLPALIKAYRMQEKTAQVGFEWKKTADVWEKVKEEIQELQEAVLEGQTKHIEEEFGDVLFSLINYARFLKIDPENALEKVNSKFKFRFEYIEKHAKKPITDMSLDEMEILWQEAKNMI